ncbi:MAG: GNAT family N-acetyltransferase [Proteobacteria bacterium]|nr:GNAT family N-acetyltransferase [Pseudomonadota bacterium]
MGIKSPYLNPLFLRKNQDSFESVLEKSAFFYGTHSCPWAVIIPEDLTTENHQHVLNSFNFTLSEHSVAMGIELQAFSKFETPENFEIKSMSHNLEEWMIPLVDAFGSTKDITHQYALTHKQALALNAHFHHYTLYIGKCPVSSLTLSLNQKEACLNDVATLPKFQKQGFASSLILFTLSQAQKLGGTHCFLDASVGAVSLYQRLGFTSLFKNNIFLKEITPK